MGVDFDVDGALFWFMLAGLAAILCMLVAQGTNAAGDTDRGAGHSSVAATATAQALPGSVAANLTAGDIVGAHGAAWISVGDTRHTVVQRGGGGNGNETLWVVGLSAPESDRSNRRIQLTVEADAVPLRVAPMFAAPFTIQQAGTHTFLAIAQPYGSTHAERWVGGTS